MVAFVIGLCGWAWGGVAPWLAWAWWAGVAPALQAFLNGCGLVLLFERAERWWTGRG